MTDATRTILILAANPKVTERLGFDKEIKEIEEGLRRSSNQATFIVETRLAVRPGDLRCDF